MTYEELFLKELKDTKTIAYRQPNDGDGNFVYIAFFCVYDVECQVYFYIPVEDQQEMKFKDRMQAVKLLKWFPKDKERNDDNNVCPCCGSNRIQEF